VSPGDACGSDGAVAEVGKAPRVPDGSDRAVVGASPAPGSSSAGYVDMDSDDSAATESIGSYSSWFRGILQRAVVNMDSDDGAASESIASQDTSMSQRSDW
jgi:hypothetical protein